MSAATAWKWMPATLLFLTVVFAAWRIQLALGDPHFAAVEDYYGQAADWDTHMEEVSASRALGWQVTLLPTHAALDSMQEVRFHFRDAEGAPLTGVEGELTAFHNAYPKQRVVQSLQEEVPGTYLVNLRLRQPGIWNWQFRLQRGEQLWIGKLQEIVDRDPGRSSG